MNLFHADAIFGQVDKSLHYIRYQMYLNNAFIRCRVVLAPDLCVCVLSMAKHGRTTTRMETDDHSKGTLGQHNLECL